MNCVKGKIVPKEENPVLLLRKSLGLSQQKFAEELDCSLSSVQGWESGRTVSPDMVDRMLAVASRNHLATLEDLLLGLKGAADPVVAAPSPGGEYNPKNKALHDMLEMVLESGNRKAIDAVVPNLVLFSDYVGSTLTRKKESAIPLKSGGKNRRAG